MPASSRRREVLTSKSRYGSALVTGEGRGLPARLRISGEPFNNKLLQGTQTLRKTRQNSAKLGNAAARGLALIITMAPT